MKDEELSKEIIDTTHNSDNEVWTGCKHKWRLLIFWRDGGQVLYWECERCGETKSYCEWSCV